MSAWNAIYWTREQDAAIRAVYERCERGGALRLAQQLKVHPRNISSRAAKLGLPPMIRKSARSPKTIWHDDEIELVRAHSGEPGAQIRARLYAAGHSRSLPAIRTLVCCLRKEGQLPDRETYLEERNCLTADAIAVGMGVNKHVVEGWIKKGWLKTKKKLPNTLHVIRYGDFRQFLIDHVGCWDHRRADRWFLVDALTNTLAGNYASREVA